jgi:hypothetical protein
MKVCSIHSNIIIIAAKPICGGPRAERRSWSLIDAIGYNVGISAGDYVHWVEIVAMIHGELRRGKFARLDEMATDMRRDTPAP